MCEWEGLGQPAELAGILQY